MKASMVANNNSSSSNLSTIADNNIIKHKLNQLLHEMRNIKKPFFNNKNQYVV